MINKEFTIWVVAAFIISYLMLSVFGLVPDDIGELNKKTLAVFGFSGISINKGDVEQGDEVNKDAPLADSKQVSYPTRISIPSLGIASGIRNPETRDVKVLDNELTRGVVRYPGSGLLGEEQNMFLFGHSTTIENVRNKNYTVFSNLKDLSPGDEIRVESIDDIHIYKVRRLSLVNADEAFVRFDEGERKLTLSTCNTFGKKQERYVVEADYVETVGLFAN